MLPQLGIEDLRKVAMMYDILELNTNVKPTFMKFLLEAYSLDALTYLDPDIFVYAPLTPVFDALDRGASAVLTPHITTPVFDGRTPSEQELLYNGTYNLGFIAVRRCDETNAILDWWERRCLDLGFSEGRTGLFVDQKWMNLAPGLFADIAILRDPGCNMAYWNLHERALTSSPANSTSAVAFLVVIPEGNLLLNAATTPSVPLRFFHFSGLTLTDPTVLSKNTNRFTLADRPDLQPLFAAYKSAVLANKDATAESLPYGFDTLSDGTTVTRLARRLYAEHHTHFAGPTPSTPTAPSLVFAKAHRLVAGNRRPGQVHLARLQRPRPPRRSRPCVTQTRPAPARPPPLRAAHALPRPHLRPPPPKHLPPRPQLAQRSAKTTSLALKGTSFSSYVEFNIDNGALAPEGTDDALENYARPPLFSAVGAAT